MILFILLHFGEVVVIEKIFEDKYFNEERIQLSIFMSMSSIHLNFMPCNGKLLKKNIKEAITIMLVELKLLC